MYKKTPIRGVTKNVDRTRFSVGKKKRACSSLITRKTNGKEPLDLFRLVKITQNKERAKTSSRRLRGRFIKLLFALVTEVQ